MSSSALGSRAAGSGAGKRAQMRGELGPTVVRLAGAW